MTIPVPPSSSAAETTELFARYGLYATSFMSAGVLAVAPLPAFAVTKNPLTNAILWSWIHLGSPRVSIWPTLFVAVSATIIGIRKNRFFQPRTPEFAIFAALPALLLAGSFVHAGFGAAFALLFPCFFITMPALLLTSQRRRIGAILAGFIIYYLYVAYTILRCMNYNSCR